MILKKALVISTFGILFTSFAYADNSDLKQLSYPNLTANSDTHIYFGLKGGQIMIDEEDTRTISDPMTYGGLVGYQFNDTFGVEIDYLMSSEESVTTKLGTRGEYDISSYGTYLTYRYPFSSNSNLYAKSKLGVGGAEVNLNYGGDSSSTDDIGIAGGIALGYRLASNVSLEGELSLLRSDIVDTNSFTVGAIFKF